MSTTPLTQVQRRGVETLGVLLNKDETISKQEASKLIREAKEFGLNLRDFLTLAIDVNQSEHPDRYRDAQGQLSGYEAALSFLNLPVANDFERGVVLDAAADTFQTYAGTRALFPQVVDDIVHWKYRQEQMETTSALVSQSRTISGIEMISTVVDDKADDYQVVRAVAETARVPVRSIRSSETAVKFYKHGGGLRYSYEFSRRARLDMLTPYQTRMVRETEISKVAAATLVLLNGDGVNAPAAEVNQSSFGTGATNGKIFRRNLIKWLISRAKAGVPVDTVVGGWDAYLEWLELFAMPTISATTTEGEIAAKQGFQLGGVPLLRGKVDFALSSAMPDGKLLGYSKGDTLEELKEAGSDIEESERSIQNQVVTIVKTENSGYKLNFGDTREVFDFSE